MINQIQKITPPQDKDTSKAIIWQVFGSLDSLFFKVFSYSILSHLKWSNILNFEVLVYISPCYMEEHRSIFEALKLLGIKFIQVKDIYPSKYFILRDKMPYEKLLLIDADIFIINKLDMNLYFNTELHMSNDKPSTEQINSWAVWSPELVRVKTGMEATDYFNLIWEYFEKLMSKEEFDEKLNYMEWINSGHCYLDEKLLKDENFINFLRFSAINKIKSDEITLLMATRLLKYTTGYNKVETAVNPTHSEEIYSKINYPIHLNGLTFDKNTAFVNLFQKILND
jgi:hypothetical protein